MGSSGVEEEEDEEPANLLRQHYDSLAVGTNGASVLQNISVSPYCFIG